MFTFHLKNLTDKEKEKLSYLIFKYRKLDKLDLLIMIIRNECIL